MKYTGEERRKTHECLHPELIAEIKAYLESNKNTRRMLSAIVICIAVQVGTFLFMWGTITNIVKEDHAYLRDKLSPRVTENTRSLDRMLSKFENVKVITVTTDTQR